MSDQSTRSRLTPPVNRSEVRLPLLLLESLQEAAPRRDAAGSPSQFSGKDTHGAAARVVAFTAVLRSLLSLQFIATPPTSVSTSLRRFSSTWLNVIRRTPTETAPPSSGRKRTEDHWCPHEQDKN